MNTPKFVIGTFFIYSLPATLIALPLWRYGRKRTRWTYWEFQIYFIPISLWIIMTIFYEQKAKGIGNFFIEPLLMGFIAPLVHLTGMRLSKYMASYENRISIGCIILVSLISIGMWAFFPLISGD